MVDRAKHARGVHSPATLPTSQPLSAPVLLGEVLAIGLRLEAAAFGIEARRAVAALKASELPLVPLYGENGFCNEAHNAFRFRRVYVEPAYGVPFLSSSDIISMRPEVQNYISRKLTKDLDRLLVKQWDVLISRSGTVGNVGLAGQTQTGSALSEHAIRARTNSPERAGYVSAFLRSRYGRPQLTGASYGSVVVHIEPSHLKHVLIPDLRPLRLSTIGVLMREAVELRDQANQFLDQADKLLHDRLKLPRLLQIVSTRSSVNSVKVSRLDARLEASYHDPIAEEALRKLRLTKSEIAKLGDPRVLSEIRPITKFRKRVYVPYGGIPLLGGKQLFQIDPVDVKGLAKGAHTKDLPEIALEAGMILVTCSGTIGRVQIIPAYMQGWTANQHATRLIAATGMNPGYLYAWLASDHGKKLITRHSYGSVILEIDKEMFASVPIPLADESTRKEVGDLVLKANELRNGAWEKERDAITQLERVIEQRHGTT
jgi:type I restriction enzyme S subunit